jgi:hypothetical protein
MPDVRVASFFVQPERIENNASNINTILFIMQR